MKLSEAILKGCESTHKVAGGYFATPFDSTPEYCCTLGAAIIGIGYEKFEEVLQSNTGALVVDPEDFIATHVEDIDLETPIPERMEKICRGGHNIFQTIALINDSTSMSREDIAKLLAECGY